MKVWILLLEHPDDPRSFVDVYATAEAAQKECDAANKGRPVNYYYVEEREAKA